VQAGNNVAPISVAGIYSIFNTVYDKPSSTFTGISTNSIDYFQYIDADNIITKGLTVTGSINVSGSVVNNLTSSFAVSASQAISASYALQASNAVSASFATSAANATTASYVLNAISASYATTASFLLGNVNNATNATSASYAATASIATSSSYAQTASFLLGTVNNATNAVTASYSLTASIATSSSYAATASFLLGTVTTAQTASYAATASIATSSSYATTASFLLGNVNNATSASYAATASNVNTLNQSVNITGSLNIRSNVSNALVVATNGLGTGGTIQQGVIGGYTFTIDGANGGGPRLGLGSTPSAGYDFFEIGAFSGANNFVTKTRDFKILSTISSIEDTRFQVFANTGNVLIQNGGTFTDNGYKLDVSGSVRFSNGFVSDGTGSFNKSIVINGSDNANLPVQAGLKLHYDSTNNIAVIQSGKTTVSGYTLKLGGNPLIFFNSNGGNEIGRFDTSGNLLINTTGSSNYKLDVSGSGRFSSGLNVTGSLNVSNGITGSLFGTASYAATASNVLGGTNNYIPKWISSSSLGSSSIYDNGTSVLIGTATDDGSGNVLQVRGEGNFTRTTNGASSLFVSNTANTPLMAFNANGGLTVATIGCTGGAIEQLNIKNIVNSSASAINLIINNNTIASINNTGLLIGTTVDNGYKLDVSGSVRFSNGLNVTGSLNVSNGITGSLFGTASYAATASYALTASYVLNAVSASVATSASYAATASYANNLSIGGTLEVNNSTSQNNVGGVNIITRATGSFTSLFCKYTVSSGSNARSGEVISVWNGSSVQYTDFSTLDIGSTSAITPSVTLVGSSVSLDFTNPGALWLYKTLVTFM